ncbi:hypothetical protein LSH36_126g09036 [Paralvinella palmiformis]|uniref:Uncharacterized protein n=1 Tax=Paralvinella palmiformis TaxID=53620 RepID=A0AAD9JX17_9ANNE|nr:hypothetical protein LSH36_126g09036 [Paralvinella palmiformis]
MTAPHKRPAHSTA